MTGYRAELFSTYERHTGAIDPADESRIAWFRTYAEANYLPWLRDLDRASTSVLEIGCNKGHLLSVLHGLGFKRLSGVDLAPAEVARARALVPSASIEAADAVEYLGSREGHFDVILIKAVLEHIQKSDVIPFLRSVSAGLRVDGRLIVDVPNMDWLFAPHERYMDFTHEVGFTRESLRQVLEAVFADVMIQPAESSFVTGRATLKRKWARRIVTTMLSWADGEGTEGPIWARGLVAMARP